MLDAATASLVGVDGQQAEAEVVPPLEHIVEDFEPTINFEDAASEFRGQDANRRGGGDRGRDDREHGSDQRRSFSTAAATGVYSARAVRCGFVLCFDGGGFSTHFLLCSFCAVLCSEMRPCYK